jgi:hypothetical protein
MADDEVITLLREIRDSQNAYIELYKNAVGNQQASIDLQKKAIRRQKIAMFIGPGIIILAIIALLLTYR